MTIYIYAFIEGRPGHRFYGHPRYIGQSKSPVKRWAAHESSSQNEHLQRIIVAHSRDVNAVSEWRILKACSSVEEANHDEVEFILHHGRVKDGGCLVNIDDGGGEHVVSGRMGGIAKNSRMTPAQRQAMMAIVKQSITSEHRRSNGIAFNAGMTREQRVANGLKGREAQREAGTLRFDMSTPSEQRHIDAMIGGAAARAAYLALSQEQRAEQNKRRSETIRASRAKVSVELRKKWSRAGVDGQRRKRELMEKMSMASRVPLNPGRVWTGSLA